MWTPRHTHQLEITVNIAKKGCAVACIVCPKEKLTTKYNLYPDKDRFRDFSFKELIKKFSTALLKYQYDVLTNIILNPN